MWKRTREAATSSTLVKRCSKIPPRMWESGIEKRAAENGFEQAASRSGLEKRQTPLPARTSARGLEEQGPEDQRKKQRTPATDLKSGSY